MYNILICDDDRDILRALEIYLTDKDYIFVEASNGAEAVEIVRNQEIHLCLMDIMMPIMDGITAMVRIREFSNVPVILLTAKSEDTDKILGLTIGADDYITKPFNPAEVVARVRSQLRRYTQLGAAAAPEKPVGNIIRIKGIELDDERKQLTVDGEEAALTPKEYDILKLLMTTPGKVYSPKEIYSKVWQDSPLDNESTVAVHVRHIREKIEINPAEPRFLKIVWGRGYKFEG